MYYFQVPQVYDGYELWAKTNDDHLKYAGKLVAHQLFTVKEYVKISYLCSNMPDLRNYGLEVSKSNVTYLTGARFLIDTFKGTWVDYETIASYYYNRRKSKELKNKQKRSNKQ